MITLNFKTTASSSWKTIKQLHRLDGKPAWQTWYTNGQKCFESYYEYDKLHRLHDKPAYQSWWLSGQKYSEEYREFGNLVKFNQVNHS